jgi:hypothetical protein
MTITHSSASTRSGACISNRLETSLFRLLGLSLLQVSTVTLESRDDIELLLGSSGASASTFSWLDGSSVDHHTRSVETSKGNHGTGHVLVTSWDDNHTIEPMTTGSGLDGIRNQVSRL